MSRRVTAVGALVALSALVGSACVLFTSLDGFSEGGSDASAEGSSSTDGEAATDAPIAGDAGDGGVTGPFCESIDAALCDDFDREPLGFGWSDVAIVPNESDAGMRLDDSAARSKPFSFLAYAVTRPNGDTEASLVRDFAPATVTTRLDVSYDILVEEIGTSRWTPITVALGPRNGHADRYDFDLFFTHGTVPGADVVETFPAGGGQRDDFATNLLRYPIPGEWSHVDIHVVTTPRPGQLAIEVDGKVALPPTALHGTPVSTTPVLWLGIYANSAPASPVKARFDNVVASFH